MRQANLFLPCLPSPVRRRAGRVAVARIVPSACRKRRAAKATTAACARRLRTCLRNHKSHAEHQKPANGSRTQRVFNAIAASLRSIPAIDDAMTNSAIVFLVRQRKTTLAEILSILQQLVVKHCYTLVETMGEQQTNAPVANSTEFLESHWGIKLFKK